MMHRMVSSSTSERYDVGLGRWVQADGRDHRHIVSRFVPEHYESGYAYPLVVWLPTRDGDERQLRRIMPTLSLRNYLAVSPRLPHWPAEQENSLAWLDSVQDVVEHAISTTSARFHTRRDAVFLMGYAEAGSLAARLALLEPARYAGVVTMNAPFPTGPCRLVNLGDARHLQFLFCVGSNSDRYTQAQLSFDLRLFHAANMTVEIRQYPGGDELTTTMLDDANRWMMQIACGSRLVS